MRAVNEEKYALQLMDALFSEQEMASSCYGASQRTKKTALDPSRIALLEGEVIWKLTGISKLCLSFL